MTRKELNRRMASMNARQIERALEMVREGYSARGMTLDHDISLKQANAIFEWVGWYGYYIPSSFEAGR